eukprot:1043-Heterococcus_DN1.PRE.5
MNARAHKRSAADDNSNPLLQANILQRVLDYVGPGHWYFISTDSSLWKDVYERVKPATSKCSKKDPDIKMTLFSSAFESSSPLRLVHSSCLYCLMDLPKREYLLGRYANKATLQTAHELTLIRYSSNIMTGAVRSGDLNKVIWLYTEQHCKLGDHQRVLEEAAMGGSVAVLAWLKQLGLDINGYACGPAASSGHLHVLQYLHAEGCDIPSDSYNVCYYAAVQGNLEMLKWLHGIGCTLDYDSSDQGEIATSCPSVELVAWLLEQSAVHLTTHFMSAAAESGNSAMCELLHAHQCPWNEWCCHEAAKAGTTKHGNLDLLRWFREHGCPWNTDWLADVAARSNSVALMEYLHQEGVVFATKRLRKYLNIAGAHDSLTTAKWLRQQGAKWPKVLAKDGGYRWSGETLVWARAEGCDSPLENT